MVGITVIKDILVHSVVESGPPDGSAHRADVPVMNHHHALDGQGLPAVVAHRQFRDRVFQATFQGHIAAYFFETFLAEKLHGAGHAFHAGLVFHRLAVNQMINAAADEAE